VFKVWQFLKAYSQSQFKRSMYFPKNVRIGFPYSSIQNSFCFATFFFLFCLNELFLYSSKVSELFFRKCCFHFHQNYTWHQKRSLLFFVKISNVPRNFCFFLIGYFLTCNSHFPPCHTLYNLLTGNIFYVLAFPSILCCISNLFGHFLPCWFLIHIQRKLEILDICHQNIFVFLLKSWLKFMFQHFFDYCILQQFYTRLKICNYDLRMYNIIVRTTLWGHLRMYM